MFVCVVPSKAHIKHVAVGISRIGGATMLLIRRAAVNIPLGAYEAGVATLSEHPSALVNVRQHYEHV